MKSEYKGILVDGIKDLMVLVEYEKAKDKPNFKDINVYEIQIKETRELLQ